MRQSSALDILKTGQNVFLTGSAGSGKTYTLNQYIDYLRARRVPVAVTASTGIAATHMNGTTIHSWSGIGIKDELSDRDLTNLSRKQFLADRLKDTAVLVIDEISMLHAKQLNLVNQVLKYIRKNDKAFGGIQVVVAGDFFQLPPIGSKGESNREKFAFMSEAWLDAKFHICYLSEQHRQVSEAANGGLDLDDILNQIRRQEVTFEAIAALENTYDQSVDIKRTRLYTHNLNVNKINDKELALLDGEMMRFEATTTGDSKLVETLKKTVRTQDELVLKVGAKVMFIKNNAELGVSNGTMGELIGFAAVKIEDKESSDALIEYDSSDDIDEEAAGEKTAKAKKSAAKKDKEKPKSKKPTTQKMPVVRLNSGREVIAEPEEWIIEDETGEVLASYLQVPLCLAWAITIHKSQGMTLDAAEIDLSRTFELGQGYVALSRLKSLAGLQLLGMNDMSLQLDPLARGADKRFLVLSEEADANYAMLDEESMQQAHEKFVLKSGGTLSQSVIDAYAALQKKRREQQQAQIDKKQKLGNQVSDKSESTLLATRVLLEESLTIAEISQARQLSQSTIMRHIGELKSQDPSLACDHLRPEDEIMTAVGNAYVAIKVANNPNDFNDDGSIKLRPIFDHLKQSIDYNTIRLALIFITP
ncbi:PIF1-like helicase [Psychrobacter pacificensis]|uniref:Helicase n=1 Tax=Psychrobacter pacificensis TaxID=112002 RepID=A0A1G6VBP3_9GAMM|nr:AAA family ATPase [Psychrobacter pacificensis]MDE0842466.1 AAA family ATPase [Psychrobacter pacificensis]GLR29518.1 helicase [Psychrobacter pacificensis]SDD51012.1 PIF1-like helicase [Psychrobacter pacificensis]